MRPPRRCKGLLRTRRIYRIMTRKFPRRYVGSMKSHPMCYCPCDDCKNPRRNLGRVTRQERIVELKEKEQREELGL